MKILSKSFLTFCFLFFLISLNGQVVKEVKLRQSINKFCLGCVNETTGEVTSTGIATKKLSIYLDTIINLEGLKAFTNLDELRIETIKFKLKPDWIFPLYHLPTNLKTLILSVDIKSLDFSISNGGITSFPDLNILSYYFQGITIIKSNPPKFKELYVNMEGNNFPINICIPFLPQGVNFLAVSDSFDQVCIANRPIGMQVKYWGSRKWIPLCDSLPSSFCSNPTSTGISGIVFYDANGNGIYDYPTDKELPNVMIKSEDNQWFALTDRYGYYKGKTTPSKSYIIAPTANLAYTNVPLKRTINFTDNNFQNVYSQDFALKPTNNFSDFEVQYFQGQARPGFISSSKIMVQYIGSQSPSSTLTLTHDKNLTLVSSSEPYSSYQSNVITWMYPIGDFNNPKTIQLDFRTLVNAPLGGKIISTAKISTTGTDNISDNNVASDSITIRGSYDPNDITVDKTAFTQKGINPVKTVLPLTYNIRFQNTGNAEAYTVEVLDTLPDKVDISLLELLDASHYYTFSIKTTASKNFVLDWLFKRINLPDSTTNEKASHGFVKYRIKTASDKINYFNDNILNKAAIYFDFNSPVITNTAKTTFLTTSVDDIASLGLKVYPNPAKDYVVIEMGKNRNSNFSIEILNLLGQVLKTQTLSGIQEQVEISDLQKGIYFLKINTPNGIGTIKIYKSE
jgi:Secretion system C-terminal sorting domain/Domain of unknown function DUF11